MVHLPYENYFSEEDKGCNIVDQSIMKKRKRKCLERRKRKAAFIKDDKLVFIFVSF